MAASFRTSEPKRKRVDADDERTNAANTNKRQRRQTKHGQRDADRRVDPRPAAAAADWSDRRAVWDVGDFLVTLSVAPGGPVESRHRHQLGSALLDAPKRIGQLFRVAAAAAAARQQPNRGRNSC